MIVTFCGHSDFTQDKKYEQNIIDFLEEKVGYNTADIYLGGYGRFDEFAYACCKKYKQRHPKISLVFVTPYLNDKYRYNALENQERKYDIILFPGIENLPRKFAISYRNKYMVDKSDYVIAYIDRDWGEAYTTYSYAKRKGKKIFNLAEFSKKEYL